MGAGALRGMTSLWCHTSAPPLQDPRLACLLCDAGKWWWDCHMHRKKQRGGKDKSFQKELCAHMHVNGKVSKEDAKVLTGEWWYCTGHRSQSKSWHSSTPTKGHTLCLPSPFKGTLTKTSSASVPGKLCWLLILLHMLSLSSHLKIKFYWSERCHWTKT